MNKRLLFLIPPRLGDALMLSPALALLKELQPEYSIDILSLSSLAASAYIGNPHCNQVYVASEIKDIDNYIKPYDLLVATHRDSKILQLTEQFKKPVILTEPANLEEHQAQQALNFIQNVFSNTNEKTKPSNYEIFPTEKEKTYIAQLLNKNKKYIGFHLGCHSQNKKNILSFLRRLSPHEKMWPVTKFIELAKAFRQKHQNYIIVLTGGENELNLANHFKKYIPDAINLVGKTNILQLAALMQQLSVYVCSDTGTMHVACAMRTPVIALFGPTNVIRTGPFPEASFRRVVITDNLLKLKPQTVLTNINDLLDYNEVV